MFEALTYPDFAARKQLQRGVYGDRARQFVDRHRWPLTLDSDGFEIDDFDCVGTTYCLVRQNDTHLASLRLRHPVDGSMVQRAFAPIWDRHGTALAKGLEVTRLCTARQLPECERRIATVELLLGLCRFGVGSGQTSLFGLVYAAVARTIARAGWESTVLDRFDHEGRTILLAHWECSPLVDWALQERSDRLCTVTEQRAKVSRILAA